MLKHIVFFSLIQMILFIWEIERKEMRRHKNSGMSGSIIEWQVSLFLYSFCVYVSVLLRGCSIQWQVSLFLYCFSFSVFSLCSSSITQWWVSLFLHFSVSALLRDCSIQWQVSPFLLFFSLCLCITQWSITQKQVSLIFRRSLIDPIRG